MTEAQIGFLYKIASAVSRSENEKTKTLLKSYYLMRCKDITRGIGLPEKFFAPKIRCPTCCIEWNKKTEINVKSIKLTKRQKQRLKSRKTKESKKEDVKRGQDLLYSNNIEQICAFCKHSNITPSIKPQKETINTEQNHNNKRKANEIPKINTLQKPEPKKPKLAKKKEINVYANALDVFSLQNKNNALATKEKPKAINNNKRKKDKFAGLCQKAVLASAKLKGKEEKKDKLSLFLKPSS
ncbi:hypothetical protein PYW07_010093 [Mythimna separata]|uniref:Uncharacterized protein n=1 Tax=Mythimna separata TaxID=271217 RepID=A0AAD7YIE3_MYTSE|nr:hypothetical protein PYW07_010093 [Mythimna separata]